VAPRIDEEEAAMTVDFSRLTFDSRKHYAGVLMQQGRVQLDGDWNEAVAQIARRLQSTAMDTFGPAEAGRAVVPTTTPTGFEITAGNGDFTIGRGRVYVDGLQVENHGDDPADDWDPRLAELQGTASISFFAQRYLPFNAAAQAVPLDVFNRPVLEGGPHLVYLDVWQREVTYLQDPDLVEKAVGVDTTARTQTVWQVRVLSGIGNATCATPNGEVEAWEDVIRPSGARLTTSTGDVPGDPNPCLVPPAAGYKGLENQLYRVEIHRGGAQGTATFKWSRDNGTVATRVTEIQGGTRLVVESLGRDDVLGFQAGEWVEIRDAWHELHGLPGVLRRIRPGDGVDAATRSILFDDALPAGLFPVDGQGRTDPERHTVVRRWDQSHPVRRTDGTTFHPLDTSDSSDGIPVPQPGTVLALENGILVEFGLVDGGEYHVGDYWVFAARATDGTIELLEEAPPGGIHHHYARLAVVTLPNQQEDCRIHWPPAGGGESCDCTVCVHADEHNAGTATIQQAIDFVRARGGTVCLDAGVYQLRVPLNLNGARSVRMRGQGWRTLLQATQAGPAMNIEDATGVAVENLAVLGAAAGGGTTALIDARQCLDLTLENLAVLAIPTGDATSAAIGLSRLVFDAVIRDCWLVAERGIVAREGAEDYLLTAQLRVTDCVLFCLQHGIRLAGASLHFGELRIASNDFAACSQSGITATGGALPGATVTIEGNVLQVTGTGLRVGTDGVRIADNEISGASAAARVPADAIVLEPGLDPGAIDRAMIDGNRIHDFGGAGIAIRHTLGQAMIKSNRLEELGGAAIAMEADASADYLCIENNHFLGIGNSFNSADAPYIGVLLLGAARADVVGNLFGNVALQAIQPPLRAALAMQASSEVRVAANRFFGIGPQRFTGRTIAIVAAANFSQLAVDDNSAARIGDGGEPPALAAWQAIVVGSRPAGEPEGGLVITPEVIVAPLNDDAIFVSAFRIGRLAARQRTVSVRGNRARSQATIAPAIEIDDVIGCLLHANDAESTGVATGALMPPVARVQCRHVTAGGNRLVGTGELPTLLLDAPRFAVVGNITSGPIQVNGAALPAPWNALNVLT
jgi:hypothetical protein